MASKAVVVGVLAVGALAAYLVVHRKAQAGDAAGIYGDAGAGGGGGLGYGDLYGADSGMTPAAGAGPGPVAYVGVLPDAQANQVVADNRRRNSFELATVASGTVLATGASAIPAVYSLLKGGAGRALGGGASREAESLAARYAAIDTGAARASLGLGGWAAGVAGGLVLGEAGVAVLDKSGALKWEARTVQQHQVGQSTRDLIETATAPLNYVGAVATGLLHGNVRSNVGQVSGAIGRTFGRVAHWRL